MGSLNPDVRDCKFCVEMDWSSVVLQAERAGKGWRKDNERRERKSRGGLEDK